jgi:hypothetical protein
MGINYWLALERHIMRTMGNAIRFLGVLRLPRAFLAAIVATAYVTTLLAATSANQLKRLNAADTALTKAEQLYKDNKLRDAASAYRQAQDALVDVAKSPELAKRLQPLKQRLVNLHDMMELDGAKLPAVDTVLMETSSSPAGTTGSKPTRSTLSANTTKSANPFSKRGSAAVVGVSFTRDVAPMLVSKCGRCHVDKSLGGLSMANYASLMQGAKKLPVIRPGDGKGSRIYEEIESGDMPRGGGKVEMAEFAMLTRWIEQGARFDGRDPTQSLTTLVGSSATQSTDTGQKLEPTMATGRETIRFSRDIAPVLVDNCLECHGTGDNPGGNLRMNTFTNLLMGGQSGLALQPGEPAKSLLVRKLKGMAGERMPFKRPALSNETIAKFEKWVAEGAHFDGLDPTEDVETTADTYKAEHSTPQELAADRLERAKKLWRLANPDDSPGVKETKNFALIGNVSPATMDEIATLAEQEATRVAQFFRAPEDKPLVKGRITLFLCRQHFDYSEFTKMVESRELPPNAQGHFHYNAINAYGVLVPPPTGSRDYSLTALLGQIIAGNYIASIGRSPSWFAEGVGAATALRLDKTDARLRGWESAIPGILSSTSKPETFLNHGLATEVNDCLSLGFAQSMMSSMGRFQQLLYAIRQGQDFESAFQRIYRLSTADAATAWVAKHS